MRACFCFCVSFLQSKVGSAFYPSPPFATTHNLFAQQRITKEQRKQIRRLSFATVKVCVKYLLHLAFLSRLNNNRTNHVRTIASGGVPKAYRNSQGVCEISHLTRPTPNRSPLNAMSETSHLERPQTVL